MLRKILKILLGTILLLPIILILLVRFTNGTISGGDKIFLGYDEDENRFQFFEKKTYRLNGIDGPYIIKDSLITVNEDNLIQKKILKEDSLIIWVNNEEKENFGVFLNHTNKIEPSIYDLPEKLIVISDIEGNFNGFSSFLKSNQVVDDELNWKYGNGHLILLGDFVDRGKNVIPTLWLIYKLESEAKKYGGKVHFILGNHEVMNIQGNFYYAEDKYKKLALEIGDKVESKENYKVLFSEDSHLGRWLRSKNTIERIGGYIFVHAGLSPKILSLNLDINEINQLVRENIDQNLYKNPNEDEKASFLMGVESPFWYRGLVMDYKYYDKVKEQELNNILKRYESNKIVIGHSIVDDISYDLNRKVIRIDVKHGKKKLSGKTKGLMIENGQEFKIDDLERKVKL